MNRVGIIGAGQLGQMLGYAGNKLGLQCTFLDPADSPPAASTGEVIADRFDSARGMQSLLQKSDVVTYEFENVPVETIASLSSNVSVYPPAQALRLSQDRLLEKQLFEELQIPLPGYRRIDTLDHLHAAASELRLPLVLKTRRMGYDGKGQCVIRSADETAAAWSALGESDLIAEQWIHFDREVSAIGVRSVRGEIAFYPLTENRHVDGILRESRAPVGAGSLAGQAIDYVGRLLTHLDYAGVLALELFVCGDTLLANEFAPRVHNSGHWTIEGAATSQFENHLRAILDQPLGATDAVAHAGMVNIIGTMPDDSELAAKDNHFLHDYGKAPRPGRKLGHFTVLGSDAHQRDSMLQAAARRIAD